ncbi:two-component system histidine kinase PnpS [Caldanaerobius polysaccharolyticus]|uniref:two-component system histidine kinase PnpS n=1 Tax=Caldanaerobius polysaccharolyticus TaxID=44256 RepID=UPI00047930FD|nr:ATP-binding protein [Caldanaerobius polysaccharolyticus]
MRKKLFITYSVLLLLGVSCTSFFFLSAISKGDIKHIIMYITLSVLLGSSIAVLLGIRFLKHITQPIYEITKIAEDISNGKLTQPINDDYEDEIGMLARAIKKMTERLNLTISELYDRNAKLEAVLTSIVNGVVAIDNEEKVLLINNAAAKILGLNADDVIGRHILELMRSSKMHDIIEDILKNKRYYESEIELFYPEYRYLKIYTNPIRTPVVSGYQLYGENAEAGLVIVLNDVTEIKKLEKMRSEFAANVSHELRTPLTSIKGFVETLREGALEDKNTADKFLEIIDLETERLTRLINDILTLSEIEGLKGDIKLVPEKVKDIVEEVIYMLKNQAEEKNITVTYDIKPPELVMNTNRDRMKQMLLNLVENGIKYTGVRGHVDIKVNAEGEKVVFSVKDDGIGIPKEHIPRLFERFYRVDKSRSRKLGGTGLGLAIVKHIVNSFNGTITVKSEVKKGTEFIIQLPLSKADS